MTGPTTVHLTHEMPCPRCGHAPHLHLPCGDGCECEPDGMPGDRLTDPKR